MKSRKKVSFTPVRGGDEVVYSPSNPQPVSEAYICNIKQKLSSSRYFQDVFSGGALTSGVNPKVEVINKNNLLVSVLVGSKRTLAGGGFNPATGKYLSDALEELGFTVTRSSLGNYDGNFLPIVNYQTAIDCLLIPTNSSYGRRNSVVAIPTGIAASPNDISPRIHTVVVRYLLCPSMSLPVSETSEKVISGANVIYRVYFTTQQVIDHWISEGRPIRTDEEVGFRVETLALPKAN